ADHGHPRRARQHRRRHCCCRPAGQPAGIVPRGCRLPHADLRPGTPGADPLPATGLVGNGMMLEPLLEVRGLTRRFGGVTAVDAFDLTLRAGELVSIIGPNGAGKTTLFNLITGLEVADAGRIAFALEPITGLSAERIAARGLARTFQHGRVFGNLSVLDNIL